MTLVLTINPKPLVSVRRERDDLADQLYQQLKEAIVLGRYREGDTLPTISDVSKQLGISTRTVQTAYTALSREELIDSNRSLGTTVRQPTLQAIIDISELYLSPVVQTLRRLGLPDEEAHALFEKQWKMWFGARRGERRSASDGIRVMAVEAERRNPERERRGSKKKVVETD